MDFVFNINNYYTIDKDEILKVVKANQETLSIHSQKLNEIMATIQELSDKADALQTALDAEQEQIAAAIAALQTTVDDLKLIVAEGGTAAERQAVADKLDAAIADLQATVA